MATATRSARDALLGTLQLAVFALLVLGPLAAGVAVGVGPPTYTAEVVDVADRDAADPSPDDTVAYASLDPASRAVVDDLLATEGDRLSRQTADPPAVLDPGERTVTLGTYAVRVAVTRSTPLRPVALAAGLLGSTLTTLAGAIVVERDLVG